MGSRPTWNLFLLRSSDKDIVGDLEELIGGAAGLKTTLADPTAPVGPTKLRFALLDVEDFLDNGRGAAGLETALADPTAPVGPTGLRCSGALGHGVVVALLGVVEDLGEVILGALVVLVGERTAEWVSEDSLRSRDGGIQLGARAVWCVADIVGESLLSIWGGRHGGGGDDGRDGDEEDGGVLHDVDFSRSGERIDLCGFTRMTGWPIGAW